MMKSEWGSVAQCGIVWKVWNQVWRNSTLRYSVAYQVRTNTVPTPCQVRTYSNCIDTE